MANPQAALKELDRQDCEEDLGKFTAGAWRWIDPAPYLGNWHLDAIAEHLEAVTHGHIRNLIINVPPRTSKSSSVSVAWPAWTWAQRHRSPLCGPHVQFLFSSYAQSLSFRDSLKTRRLIQSPWYQGLWSERFALTGDQNAKQRFENTSGGYRLATSVGGSLTGEGGTIIVVDDPHNTVDIESDAIRESTVQWWDEALSTRLNDPKTGAYVIIMQRLFENDLTGHVLAKNHGEWEHLMLPMRYDGGRHCVTSIGWEDPREVDGELLWPERFGEPEVAKLERALGPFGAAGQLQQLPSPRGGGIFKRDWWQPWEPEDQRYPPFDYIIASLDPAYTEKQENDYSALTVWGIWRDRHDVPKIMLMHAWRKRLELHGPDPEPRKPGESESEFKKRCRATWGLVEWVADSCKRFKADRLLIEAKASGHSVAQEMRRLYAGDVFGVQLVDPGRADKVARAYAVQPLFADGAIYAPALDGDWREWVMPVIDEMASFPKSAHDDLVDSATMALGHFRETGLAVRREEQAAVEEDRRKFRKAPTPLYPT